MENTKQEEIRRYLHLSNYNMIRILSSLEEILKENGAKIVKYNDDVLTTYKCFTSESNPERIKKIESLPEIKRLDFKWVSPTYCIKFVLNNYYYSFEYNDNPFFPLYFNKIKIDDDGSYVGKRYVYSSDEKKYHGLSIAYDAIFRICSDKDIKELAKDLYNNINKIVINGYESERISEKRRFYDYSSIRNSYHYEKIYDTTKCNALENTYFLN